MGFWRGNLLSLEGIEESQWMFGIGPKGTLKTRWNFRGPRVDLGVGFEGS